MVSITVFYWGIKINMGQETFRSESKWQASINTFIEPH